MDTHVVAFWNHERSDILERFYFRLAQAGPTPYRTESAKRYARQAEILRGVLAAIDSRLLRLAMV